MHTVSKQKRKKESRGKHEMTHLSPISAEISKQKTLVASKDQRLLSSGLLNRVQHEQTQQSFRDCVFQTF